ncbi:histidine phosphotransferase ChpT [Mangrovibrevibacter kandeliae]|uniref:histidine phosphotransferase ChpT n=1 Tax=Mangrovibrevibacter kandeliae TaxID=2968473 RepID=UPI002117C16D|nr:histidine phosphotransferase family protein [Aurantimonas sp. CSK15Z-1]MCQ8784180.1 histidine phosphotransferase family protein [Aurantimonas sp. CSK15Z-1]MCQ8784259.1 histidine phosphotransferase family protein [Aurantimonas sp. CSK15Z-1]
MNLPEVSASDLAALLASRLCHDIISPVGAVQSGLELLDEMPNDPESMALVRNSTKSAVAKLQFARIAYGASGSTTAQIDLGDAQSAAEGFMSFERANLTWTGARAYVAKNVAKVLLNLLVVANASVPRGREVVLEIDSVEPVVAARLIARGKPLRVPAKFKALLEGAPLEEGIDAHAIQPYYTLLLARETGLSISLTVAEEEAVFTVASVPAQPV